MRMVERRQLALAHEFPRADLDDRDARRIVEMRNDPLGHVFVPHSPAAVSAELLGAAAGAGTIAIGSNDG
jgi:hypothetical protein